MPAFSQITDDGFPGAKSLDFVGQRIVYVEPFGRYWGWSDLVDGSSWNTLNQAQAETSPDRIQGLIVSHNEVLIFGERTIEPWASAPTDTAVFQLQVGSVIESGCAAGRSIQRLDNSVFYLTNNGQVAKLNGYTPQVISTAAMEASIRGLNWSRAFAFTWEDAGHVVYYITFPDGHTWGFDVRQNKWHRRASYGLDRWRINALAKSNGKYIAGDYSSGRVYEVEWGNVYEACEIMPRTFRSGVLHNASNRVRVDGFRIVAATGQPPMDLTLPVAPTPAEYELLVTGNIEGGDVFVWAQAFATASPSFVGIAQGTGADIPGGIATYTTDVGWSAVGADTTRYGSLLSAWATAAIDTDAAIADHYSSGPGGAMATFSGDASTQLYFGYNEEGVFTAFTPSATFSTGSVFTNITNTAMDYWWSTENYWFACNDRTLLRADTPQGPYVAVRDQYTNAADGLDNNGAVVVGFPGGVENDGWLYLACEFHFDAGVRRAQIRRSPDGGATIPDDEILYNALTSVDPTQPVQGVTGGGHVVFLCNNMKVLTSANDFATPISTGISSSVALNEPGRRIAYVGPYLYVIGAGSIVVSTDGGLTWGEPIDLPIANVTSIASNYVGTAIPVVDTCTPMEGGLFQLRYANDGSENWSNWRDFEAPTTGRFLQPLVARRLGMARHRVWEVMDTSNRPQDVLAAEIIAQ